MTTSTAPHPAMVEAARRRAELHVSRTRRLNTRAVVAAIVASTVSAFLTAVPAAVGSPLVGTWRLTCMVASVFAAAAAITTGLQAQLRFADQLASATECLGRLRALELQASLGVIPADDLARQFAEIVGRYPEFT